MTAETRRRQAFLDKIVPLVVKQGKRSVDERGKCLYRGPNGLKCAIGFAIPDDRYDPNMDGNYVASVVLQLWRGVVVEGLQADDAAFADAVQSAHDKASGEGRAFITDFMERVRKVAERFGLTVPQIEGNPQ